MDTAVRRVAGPEALVGVLHARTPVELRSDAETLMSSVAVGR